MEAGEGQGAQKSSNKKPSYVTKCASRRCEMANFGASWSQKSLVIYFWAHPLWEGINAVFSRMQGALCMHAGCIVHESSKKRPSRVTKFASRRSKMGNFGASWSQKSLMKHFCAHPLWEGVNAVFSRMLGALCMHAGCIVHAGVVEARSWHPQYNNLIMKILY